MLASLLLATALAADPPAEPAPEPPPDAPEEEVPETVELPSIEPLPSALDDPEPIALAEGEHSLQDLLDVWRDQRRDRWSSNLYLKPAVSLLVAPDAQPLQLGLQAGRRWWQLRDGVAASFQLGGTADFALAGGAGSYDLGLSFIGGPWLRYVGLQVGPGIGASSWQLGSDVLEPATGVDAWAVLVADLKAVHLLAGAAPRWFIGGERASAADLPLGDELALRAGAGVTLGTVRVGADLTRRITALGPLDRFGLNFRFRLL